MPRTRTLTLQAFAVLAWLASSQGLYVHFDVQQALAGDEFGSAGSVSGDLAESSQLFSKLTWDRPATTDAQKQQFAEAVKNNRYVRVQVPSNPEDASSAPVLGAVPARCLAGSGKGFESSGTPAGNTEFSESQQAVTAGPEGKEGAKKGAPKDERPWLQKNWIFLIPAGMLVLNLLGGQAEPAQAGRAGPAAAGAAAPAVTSGRSRRGR